MLVPTFGFRTPVSKLKQNEQTKAIMKNRVIKSAGFFV